MQLLLGGLFTASLAQPVEIPPPSAVRAVVVGQFDSAGHAAELVNQLQTLGYGPVWTHPLDERTAVLVGRCETLPEATLLRQSLRQAGFADAHAKAFRDLVEQGFTTEVTTPDEPVFGPPLASGAASGVAFDPESRFETASFLQLRNERYLADAIQEGRDALANLDVSDPARGWLSLNIGHTIVTVEKKAAPAMEFILPVARGEVAADPADRLRAQIMAADAWHYYYFKPLQAFAAYKEILATQGDADPALRARLMVEINACLLELARSQAAYFNEVRRYSLILRRDVPAVYTRAHAVADLLHSESLMYEGLMDEARAELEGFAFRHPSRPRETAMAHMALGNIGAQTKNWDLCRHHYEQVLEVDLSDPSENYYWAGERWNLREKAAKWLAYHAEQFGDIERRNQYQAYLDAGEHLEGQPEEGGAFDVAFPHGMYTLTD